MCDDAMFFRLPRFTVLSLFAFAFSLLHGTPGVAKEGYAIVVSEATGNVAEWAAVVDALKAKHEAASEVFVVTYGDAISEVQGALTQRFPRHTCFVARPEEAGREFVAQVHQLTRRLDDDPYTDTRWGILTGYGAAAALRIARHSEPLTIHRVASGTELAMEMIEEGVWYCELNKNKMVRKRRGEQAEELRGPDDTTKALVDALNVDQVDLFVTSGHATERDWQIGFRYRNGYFRCKDGRLFGQDTAGTVYPIDSPNPKVYLPIGNCLMGHIGSREAMALAWMNSAGVQQMIGYTVPTWFGYAGWGCLDYFVEQPGRYTFGEAFLANHHALVHRLETEFPDEDARRRGAGRGLLYDRDTLAFYGDPAWDARMSSGPVAWKQSLTEADGLYTLTILPQRGLDTFHPINGNGSQRGGRPIIQFLPARVANVEVVEGGELNPTITDDFVLVPNPGECDPARRYEVVFRAESVE